MRTCGPGRGRRDESRADIVGLYHRSWQHADETIAALPLDAPGLVPWWSDNADVTLHRVIVHMIAETQRHAGHADIVRELIDGAAGFLAGRDNLPPGDQAWWRDYRDRVEEAARAAQPRWGLSGRAQHPVEEVIERAFDLLDRGG
jgi:hypothetical protein